MNVKLTKIDHFLSNSLDMTESELAQVSATDLNEYRVLYSTIPSDYESDREEARKIHNKVEQLTDELYGAYSNQSKYTIRNWHKGLDIVGSHYAKYEDPSRLECRVEDAIMVQQTLSTGTFPHN
tara:strand:- start:444 stop:815 length:372 start_codon:yes stop_codon:yes gene_type:complete